MESLIEELKNKIKEASESKNFVHHQWFVKYHLEIVEKIALELCDIYKEADKNLVLVLVWMHDYGKILDYKNEHEKTLLEEKELLNSIGFDDKFSDKVLSSIREIDNSVEQDLSQSSIEVKIVSSADAGAHFIGPFFGLWLYENSDKPIEELLQGNINKAKKDWERKMVLPEVKKAFEKRYKFVLEQNGILADRVFLMNIIK